MGIIAKSIVFALLTLLACGLLAFATWYSSTLLITGAYKVVAFFLGFILISNILAKYILWLMEPEPETSPA